jgi:hypothetical protein
MPARLRANGHAYADFLCPPGYGVRHHSIESGSTECSVTLPAANDPYERLYYSGILCERRAKAQLNAGQPPHMLPVLFEQALHFS